MGSPLNLKRYVASTGSSFEAPLRSAPQDEVGGFIGGSWCVRCQV